MTQDDVRQFIQGAEDLVQENENVLKLMQDYLPNLKLRSEKSRLLIDNTLYEQHMNAIKSMEQHIQRLKGYIETYKKVLSNWPQMNEI